MPVEKTFNEPIYICTTCIRDLQRCCAISVLLAATARLYSEVWNDSSKVNNGNWVSQSQMAFIVYQIGTLCDVKK